MLATQTHSGPEFLTKLPNCRNRNVSSLRLSSSPRQTPIRRLDINLPCNTLYLSFSPRRTLTLTLEPLARPIAMDFRSSNPDRESSNKPERLYNPYQNLHLPAKTLYKLPTSPEFLFSEESIHQRRSWGENLTFYTGCGYLAGSAAGAASGILDGVKAIESGDSLKLKINRLLNSSGHKGRIYGNRLGVIGLLYAGIESGIVAATDRDDLSTSFLAGIGTGAVFKAARGVRSAAVAGAVGGVAAAAAVAGKQAFRRYVPI